MAAKVLSFLILALVAQGYCVEIITLEDQTINYLTNPLIGSSMTIPKALFDTLQSCHIIFPDGVTYEAFPTSNLPKSTFFFLDAVDIFRACGVGFRGIDLADAGTYELLSMVQHSSDQSLSLTRQKFNIVVSESDDWHFPGMPDWRSQGMPNAGNV